MSDTAGSPQAVRPSRRARVRVWPVLVIWAAMMAPLARWGLPSRADDDLLFGGKPAWDAARYQVADALDARRARAGGADTDLNPLADRTRIVSLTSTEFERAEILRRYRLFSRQPDEMITFMALQRMRPREGDFDPRLYQYGGGYIYLVGYTLAAGSVLGLVPLHSGSEPYLREPEQFARFYLAGRLLTLVFGALLLGAVWRLGRWAAGRTGAWLALVLVACTPVFITGVLEAKPHVPSVCLVLWATWWALGYARRGGWGHALRLGRAGGYAAGLVLTGLAAAALWPPAALVRMRARRPALKWLALAALVFVGVYAGTNPYLCHHLLFDRGALRGNLSNSTAMYAEQVARAGEGLIRVGQLLFESCGVLIPLAGLVGVVILARRRLHQTLVFAAPGAAMLALSVFLAAGKPAEFARFLLLPVVLLCIAAAAGMGRLLTQRRGPIALLGAVLLLSMATPAYLRSFALDGNPLEDTRRQAGLYLEAHAAAGEHIGVLQEPAPYAVPPLDFTRRSVDWLPPTAPVGGGALPRWLVFTADDADAQAGAWWQPFYERVAEFPGPALRPSRIAWANKPVFIYRLR